MFDEILYPTRGEAAGSLAALFQTEAHREGVRTFLEKREPRYVGR